MTSTNPSTDPSAAADPSPSTDPDRATDPARAIDPAGPSDWTRGGMQLVFQRCDDCGQRWYFRRRFCPACGRTDPAGQVSSGLGTVHAVTTIHRAPDPGWRAVVPYTLVLVDLDDGFRAMGHGAGDLSIGQRVRGRIRPVAGRDLPWFDAD